MIFADLTYNASTIYLSDSPREHRGYPYTGISSIIRPSGEVYHDYLISIDEIRQSTRWPWGGWARVEYGTMVLAHQALALWGTVAPPRRIGVDIYYVPDTWGATVECVQLLHGKGYLQTFGREAVSYALYQSAVGAWDEYEVEGGRYSGTLNSVFAAACAAMGLDYDNALIRTVSPPSVDYTIDGKRLLVDALDEIAAACSHRFIIENAVPTEVLRLIDVFGSNGNLALTMDDATTMVDYVANPPARRFAAAWPCSATRGVQLLMRERSDGTTDGIMALAEVKVYASVGSAAPLTPNVATNVQTDISYPVSNLVDGNTTTDWRTHPAGFPPPYYSTNGATLSIWRPSGQSVAEYQLTASNAGGQYAPGLWGLYGMEGNTGTYRYIQDIEARGWTAGEVRKFQVPQEWTWKLHVDGSDPEGSEVMVEPICTPSYGIILGMLGNIKATYEKMRVRMQMPMQTAAGVPKIGMRCTYTDTAIYGGITSWFKVASVVYDLNSQTMVVEGEGELV